MFEVVSHIGRREKGIDQRVRILAIVYGEPDIAGAVLEAFEYGTPLYDLALPHCPAYDHTRPNLPETIGTRKSNSLGLDQ
jgi:hypothetical protein